MALSVRGKSSLLIRVCIVYNIVYVMLITCSRYQVQGGTQTCLLPQVNSFFSATKCVLYSLHLISTVPDQIKFGGLLEKGGKSKLADINFGGNTDMPAY